MKENLIWTTVQDGTDIGIAWTDNTRSELHLWFRRPQTQSEIGGAATDLRLPPSYVGYRACGMWFTQLKLSHVAADATIVAVEGLLTETLSDIPKGPHDVGGEISEDGHVRIAAYRTVKDDDSKFDEYKQYGFVETCDGRIVTGMNWSRRGAYALVYVLRELRSTP